MIAKLFGQFILAGLLVQTVPTDASTLEFLARSNANQSRGLAGFVEEIALPEPVFAIAEQRALYPVKVDTDSYGVVTTAKSVLVKDAKSGMILLGEKPYEIRSIGSVTKLMTVLVFLETNPDLTKFVTLTTEDIVYGGRIYLYFSDALTLRDVVGASLVGSDNTATNALIRFSGLSETDFIARMNEKAQELGMENSTFVDATGISAENQSTASEVILLLEATEQVPTMKTFMQTPVLTVTHASGRSVAIESTNGLLQSYLNEGEFKVIGGKTGYLPQAGYVLATTVQKGSDAVHIVVMGSATKDTRVNEAKGLAAWAYKVFRFPTEL